MRTCSRALAIRPFLDWAFLSSLAADEPLAPEVPLPRPPVAGPRPALPPGAEVSAGLLRAMPTRIRARGGGTGQRDRIGWRVRPGGTVPGPRRPAGRAARRGTS